jgi:hypothetical protein
MHLLLSDGLRLAFSSHFSFSLFLIVLYVMRLLIASSPCIPIPSVFASVSTAESKLSGDCGGNDRPSLPPPPEDAIDCQHPP